MSEPHKCPVCDGATEVVDERAGRKVPCKPCKGTGVVWDPGDAAEAAKQPTAPDPLDLTYQR